jgi:serine/threonine-protein phosphatase 6 regulatory subunit 3
MPDSSDLDDDPPPALSDEEQKPVIYKNAHKFPYICSELLCGEVGGVIDILVGDESLLGLLFSLLDRPAPLDPSTVSYFRKVLQVLIQRQYTELVSFCSRNGILDKLLRHLGLYSILEILIMTGWDSGWDTNTQEGSIDQTWMLSQGLIPKLVRKLHPRFARLPDVHAHAGRLLVDVVVKCPLNHSSPLVDHLQTTPVLRALFQHMFSACPSSLSNSLSVLIVLVQRFANRRLEQLDHPTDESPSNPEDFVVASGQGDEEGEPEDAEHEAEEQKLETESSTDPLVLELGEPFISLLPHLPRILNILLPDSLKDASSSSSSAPSPTEPMVVPGVLGSAPFGSLRMKVVELCLVLARSRSGLVDDLLARYGVAKTMIEVFFNYPWNNLLHGLVESILTSALEEPESAFTRRFFADGLLVESFIGGWERNEEVVKQGGMRLGYMGHLLRTAATVNMMMQSMTEEQRDTLLQGTPYARSLAAHSIERARCMFLCPVGTLTLCARCVRCFPSVQVPPLVGLGS